jgi:hypothetical protein
MCSVVLTAYKVRLEAIENKSGRRVTVRLSKTLPYTIMYTTAP